MNLIQTLEMDRNTETHLKYVIWLKENWFQLVLFSYLFYFQGFNQAFVSEESVHHETLECSTLQSVSQEMFFVHY